MSRILPSMKEWLDEKPFYSEIRINPLDYHGYRYTKENVEMVIEELQYELSKYPEYSDILLDHILSVKNLTQVA